MLDWMSRWNLGSVGYNPNIPHLYVMKWNNPLILTIDPNLQRDIQVDYLGTYDQNLGTFIGVGS